MKFYCSGKWSERKEVRELQDKLIELGHTITVDWTPHKEEDEGYPSDYAEEDIIGVRECNIYVGLFVNRHNYKGALVEMGAALALNKIVVIIGHAIDSCLFKDYPYNIQVETVEGFINYIRIMGQHRKLGGDK